MWLNWKSIALSFSTYSFIVFHPKNFYFYCKKSNKNFHLILSLLTYILLFVFIVKCCYYYGLKFFFPFFYMNLPSSLKREAENFCCKRGVTNFTNVLLLSHLIVIHLTNDLIFRFSLELLLFGRQSFSFHMFHLIEKYIFIIIFCLML